MSTQQTLRPLARRAFVSRTNLHWLHSSGDPNVRLLLLKLETFVYDRRAKLPKRDTQWHDVMLFLHLEKEDLVAEINKRRPNPARIENLAIECCAVLLKGILDQTKTTNGHV